MADRPTNYETELETGIFNMIITLCQHKGLFKPMPLVKEEVAGWLEEIAAGLRAE